MRPATHKIKNYKLQQILILTGSAMNRIILSLYISIFFTSGLVAEPYIPNNDAQVLLKLHSPKTNLKTDKDNSIDSPQNLASHYKVIAAMLERAKQSSSERLYGEAETMLYKPGVAINRHQGLLLIKADIQQHFHQFEDALITLQSIKHSPQARLLEANILLTQGEYEKARQACTGLIGNSSLLLVTTCITQTISMRGQLTESYTLLQKVFEQYQNNDPDSHHWALTSLAEMAERLSDDVAAINYYQQAIQILPTDIVSRIALFDLHLKHQNTGSALSVLNGHDKNDALLLRAIRAADKKPGQNKDKSKQTNLNRLKQRIALLEVRNDNLHLDTLAEYYLYINRNPTKAAKWARAHWTNQKTPRDARLLLRAAVQANDINSIQLLRNWQQLHNFEDHWLELELSKYTSSDIMGVKN